MNPLAHARRAAAAAVVTLLAGCASNAPLVDHDPSADFSAYRDYAFISEHPMMRAPDSPPTSPLLESRLMRVTDEVLTEKGFNKVDDPEAADFTVAFTVGTRDKIDVRSYPEPYHPYYGRWGWGAAYYGGVGMGVGAGRSVDLQQYTEGTLAIDIYDVDAHRPVWHGALSGRITEKMRRNPDETTSAAVREILAGFPPGADDES